LRVSLMRLRTSREKIRWLCGLAMLDGEGKNAGGVGSTAGGARRLARVLKDVAERAGWGRTMPANEGLGIGVGHGQERGMPTWVACVAHVAVDPVSGDVTLKSYGKRLTWVLS
jgi:CO/xanthine dehydrogenase Mo-binding subunit